MKNIPADYKVNYTKKLENAQQMSTTATDKAKNVFFEKIPEERDGKMPDRKNFVKFDESAKAALEVVPTMSETLRHVIPPEVRAMQGELKQFIQNTVDQKFEELKRKDTEERAFLGQYQLPQSFYELTSTAGIPEQYLDKITEFQKKGAISNFTNIVANMDTLRESCRQMLLDTEKELNEEE